MEITNAVRQFIVDEFAPDIDANELNPDYDLLESGIVDSLGLLPVLAWAEDSFGVAIDVGEVEEDDFRTIRAVCTLIERSAREPQGTAG